MKKFIPLIISGILVVGAVGCGEENANTGSESPSTANNEAVQPSVKEASEVESLNQTGTVPEAGNTPTDPAAVTGTPEDLLETDLSKEVGKELKKNLPTSNLEVKDNKEGVVTIGGTVSSKEDLEKIPSLAKEVKGVEGVNVEANVGEIIPVEGIDSTEDAKPAEGSNPQ